MRILLAAIVSVFLVFPAFAEYVNHDKSVVKIEVDLPRPKGMPKNVMPGKHPHGSGTGWYIGNGIFVTNDHVTSKAGDKGRIFYKDEEGKEHTLKVIAKSVGDDLALAQSEDPVDLPPLKISEKVPPIGEEVEVIGYPGGQDKLHFWSRVGSNLVDLTGKKAANDDAEMEHSVFKFGAPTVAGMSGGPVLNSEGEVVGIDEAAWPVSPSFVQNFHDVPPSGPIAFVIPATRVLDLLNKEHVDIND